MTEMLGVADAKRRFSELISRVAGGERFVVARRGKPVLALVPPDEAASIPERKAGGLLALAGLAADFPDLEATMAEIVRSRHSRRSRPAPTFD